MRITTPDWAGSAVLSADTVGAIARTLVSVTPAAAAIRSFFMSYPIFRLAWTPSDARRCVARAAHSASRLKAPITPDDTPSNRRC
jgi:hypothetical protein